MLVEFDHDPTIVDGYLALTRRVHRDDPLWIEPLRGVTRTALGAENPFFQDGDNRYRGFALRIGDRLAGHVLATVNGQLESRWGRTGALGFMEVEPDYALFDRLVTAAASWLRDEAGVQRIWATMNFDIWHGYRVMTRGFELPAFFGEPRNGPWLPEFLQRYGFAARKRWVSATTSREFLLGRAPYFKERFDVALADGYRLERLTLGTEAQMMALHQVVSAAFGGFEGYTPIPFEQFRALLTGFLRLTGTELASRLIDPDDRLVGFSIAFADPSGTLRRLRGRDDWLNRWRLLFRPAPDRALHYMIGVLPEARAEHDGLGSTLMYRTLQRILQEGYPRTTFALMADDSPARYFAMDQAETAERQYALFELRT